MQFDINDLREERQKARPKDLFQHQIDAITLLKKIFTFEDNQYRAGLLVLPTGAGKTYTTVKWLNDFVIPKGIKILWLAHTFHLLDQAFETLVQNVHWVQNRQLVNIKRISSHPSHEKIHSIDPVIDDVLIPKLSDF